ncbi:unnamed protein product [Prorocentrum cordatum]|uniref:Apple domain-containing protein n=1 Tax=Prorocentrum cordatum TaxID=2364126 RepID=A0ABN9TMN0_9DINO|nr:unnamed protein product [Polarella glacialis]
MSDDATAAPWSSPVKGGSAGPLAARAVRLAAQGRAGAAAHEEAAALLEDGGRPSVSAGACSGGRKTGLLLLLVSVAVLLILDGTRTSIRESARRPKRTVELEGEESCHTAREGEECHTLVSWVMKVARRQGNADWGGLGVTPSSTREEVQQALHLSEEEERVCPRPCGGGNIVNTIPDMARPASKTMATTTTADAKYMQDRARAMALIQAAPTQDPHAAAAEADLRRDEVAYKAAENKATAAHALAGPGGRMHTPAAVSASGCGVIQEMVYLPGNDLHTIPNVSRPEDCCKVCAQAAECVAWTWGRRLSESSSVLPHGAHMCYLKGSKPRLTLSRVFDPDFTSGWTTPAVKPSSISTQWPMDGASLLCASPLASLASPGLGEEAGRSLLALQYGLQASLFACDEYMVFAADDERPVAPGVWPVRLAEPEGQTGGRSLARSGAKDADARMVVLEAKLLLWRLLIQSSRYRFHDWTVIVDPQTVFISGRASIRHIDEPPTGTSVSACEDHPSRALEVLSRRAVDAWSVGWERCLDSFALHEPTNQSREEVPSDWCLGVLQARCDTDTRPLSSPECAQTWQANGCSNVSFAAYHPFGTEESYKRCLQQSTSSVR